MRLKIKSNIPNIYLKTKDRNRYTEAKKLINEFESQIQKNKNFYNLFSSNYPIDFNKKNLNKFKKFNQIVIVGMGGSILGIKAIYSVLEKKIKKKIIFLDNLNYQKSLKINKGKIKNSLFIFISKSGNTLETITNINSIEKVKFTKKNTIIITENKKSALFNFAIKNKIKIIQHKKYIGGRYSVLSEVGIIPAYLMGLNINSLRQLGKKLFDKNVKKILIKNSLENSKLYKSKKINTIICFNYSPKLNNLILWLQQLIAESLGKNKRGLIPILSPAPKDHHSLLQLYLDGPKDKIFYVFSDDEKMNKKIKKNQFENKYNFLINKNFKQVLKAQKNAFIQILKKQKIPFKEIYAKDLNEKFLNEFFSYFIFEVILTAKLMKIDPFNQPAVEQVKILTNKSLFK